MNPETLDYGQAPLLWFAIRVKSRCEKAVAMMARHKGFEDFLPLYQSRRRWSDRVQSVELPLFPGYVFCRLNPLRRLPLLTIPGVLHFVGIGRTPLPLDEAEIANIQTAVQSGLWVEPCSYLDIGQRVRIAEGPLTGLDGIYLEAPKRDRIVVSVTMLKRSVAVTIERHWVMPLDAQGRPMTTLRRLTAPATALEIDRPNLHLDRLAIS